MKQFVLLFLGFMPMFLCAQNYIEAGYTPSRTFLDKDRNNCGSGDLWQIKGMYSHTFSTKLNENGQPIVWAGTINGMYAKMNNKGYAAEYNPEQILNLGFNLTYIRPLTKKNPKWYMMASIGAGIYAAPNDIAWRSILVNGGVVFVYRLAKGLDVGVGAGLTTSFGVPLVMPMTFVKWTSTGQYEITIEAMSNIRASVARRFGNRFRLELVPCDMDGMSSVFRQDGKNKLYSVMRMRAYIHPEKGHQFIEQLENQAVEPETCRGRGKGPETADVFETVPDVFIFLRMTARFPGGGKPEADPVNIRKIPP